MKKQFLSLIAAGLMFGGASHIQAMDKAIFFGATACTAAGNHIFAALSKRDAELTKQNETKALDMHSKRIETMYLGEEMSELVAAGLDLSNNQWVKWDHNKMIPYLQANHGVINPDDPGQKCIALLASNPSLIIGRLPVSPINRSESFGDYWRRLLDQKEAFLRNTTYTSEEGVERRQASQIARAKWTRHPFVLPPGWHIPTQEDRERARGEQINDGNSMQ